MKERTQIEISSLLEITQAMVSQILNGKRPVSWAMANKLSATFGRSPAWWMTARTDRICRVLRTVKTDGSKNSGGQNGKEQRRAA